MRGRALIAGLVVAACGAGCPRHTVIEPTVIEVILEPWSAVDRTCLVLVPRRVVQVADDRPVEWRFDNRCDGAQRVGVSGGQAEGRLYVNPFQACDERRPEIGRGEGFDLQPGRTVTSCSLAYECAAVRVGLLQAGQRPTFGTRTCQHGQIDIHPF